MLPLQNTFYYSPTTTFMSFTQEIMLFAKLQTSKFDVQ